MCSVVVSKIGGGIPCCAFTRLWMGLCLASVAVLTTVRQIGINEICEATIIKLHQWQHMVISGHHQSPWLHSCVAIFAIIQS